MEDIDNELNRSLMADLVRCTNCKAQFDFIKGKAADAPKTTDDGKKIDSKYFEEFANYRFLCPNCKTEQCKTC